MVKKLGVHSFGELTLAFSIYLVFAGLSDFGSRLYCWKSVLAASSEDRPSTAVNAWMARTALAALFLVPIFLGIVIFAKGWMEPLLLLYSVGVLANQVAFDWFFLSLDRVYSLFIFNTSSGVLYLLFLILLVHKEGDMWLVPLGFVLSYLFPAFFLMGKDVWRYGKIAATRFGSLAGIFSAAIAIPTRSYTYFFYDFLQRLSATSIFFVAWRFYSKSMIGEFRVSHLLFTFVASVSVYLGASLFNRVHEETAGGKTGISITYGVIAIMLVVLPFSISGYGITAPFVKYLLGSHFDMPSLLILISGLCLPALGSFIRETSVAAGHARIGVISYLTTILTTMALIVAIHPNSLGYLASSLLIGEGAGLVVLMWLLPFPLLETIKGRTVLIPALIGGVFLVLERVLSLALAHFKGVVQTVGTASAIAGLFFLYLLIIRKHGVSVWVNTSNSSPPVLTDVTGG